MQLSLDQRAFARGLRQRQTEAEHRIWSRLRGRRLCGCKFRRQHPVGPYFADFACIEIGLAIELDGGQHAEKRAQTHDVIRSDVLAGYGLEVMRFWDNDVLRETDAVIAAIARKVMALTRPAADLSRKAGEGVEEPSPGLRPTSPAKPGEVRDHSSSDADARPARLRSCSFNCRLRMRIDVGVISTSSSSSMNSIACSSV